MVCAISEISETPYSVECFPWTTHRGSASETAQHEGILAVEGRFEWNAVEKAEAEDPFDDFEDDDFDDEFDDDFEEDWEDDLPEDEEFPDTFGGEEEVEEDEEEPESPFSDDPEFDDE